jgi:hypothetical protein
MQLAILTFEIMIWNPENSEDVHTTTTNKYLKELSIIQARIT